ncbi:MAG: hypothetical protein JWN04_1185, partial [Myxococcaceae bacterium]|nr:hypothetical protein [Myxococcaceae bacterium]
MKFGLVMRAYAPFNMFGLAFHGDNRGPSTRSDVTSRVKAGSYLTQRPARWRGQTPSLTNQA